MRVYHSYTHTRIKNTYTHQDRHTPLHAFTSIQSHLHHTHRQVISRRLPGAVAVGTHSPQGDGPYGSTDMLGNVWEYTSEYVDLHTRGVMLRGGSNYMAGINGTKGIHWYDSPQGVACTIHPSVLRAACVTQWPVHMHWLMVGGGNLGLWLWRQRCFKNMNAFVTGLGRYFPMVETVNQHNNYRLRGWPGVYASTTPLSLISTPYPFIPSISLLSP